MEGGGVTLRKLRAIEFLAQEADPSGITLVDSCNGFNNLSRLAILWTVRHCWPSGAKFASNCYKAWAQLLLRQLGGGSSYNYEPRGVNSVIPPRDGIVRDHPRPPGRGVKSGRSPAFILVLGRLCGDQRFGMTKCTALKSVDGEGAGPGAFARSIQVTLHLGHTGAGRCGEEVICVGGDRTKLCECE